MEKNILIVDDDPIIHQSLSLYLLHEGFTVTSAFDGEEGLKKFAEVNPLLVILDMMMPKMNGNDVCREIRKTSSTPIIILTAKSEEIDKILGLELGADDYVTKPFSSRELVARINSVLRRAKGASKEIAEEPSKNDLINLSKDFYLIPSQNCVMIYNHPIYLTNKEYEILEYCVINKNTVVTREKIFNEVWGKEFEGDYRLIDTHIKKIRQKIYVDQAKWLLTSIYGLGYKFEYLG